LAEAQNDAGKREDVCQVSIGNLPPGKECRLSIRYVMELDVEEDALRFTLPATRTRLSKIEGDEVKLLALCTEICRRVAWASQWIYE
jgi:hypothetical protein